MFLFERPKRNRKSRHPFDGWTTTWGPYPQVPRRRQTAGHLTADCSRPYPAGRGNVPQPAAKPLRKGKTLRPNLLFQTGNSLPIRKTLRPDKRLRDRQQLSRCGRTVSPGLQGKAGSRRWRDSMLLIFGGGVGGKAPNPSSTDSERWHLSCLLLSVTKEVRPTAASREKRTVEPFFFLLSVTKEEKKTGADLRQDRPGRQGTFSGPFLATQKGTQDKRNPLRQQAVRIASFVTRKKQFTPARWRPKTPVPDSCRTRSPCRWVHRS